MLHPEQTKGNIQTTTTTTKKRKKGKNAGDFDELPTQNLYIGLILINV